MADEGVCTVEALYFFLHALQQQVAGEGDAAMLHVVLHPAGGLQIIEVKSGCRTVECEFMNYDTCSPCATSSNSCPLGFAPRGSRAEEGVI